MSPASKPETHSYYCKRICIENDSARPDCRCVCHRESAHAAPPEPEQRQCGGCGVWFRYLGYGKVVEHRPCHKVPEPAQPAEPGRLNDGSEVVQQRTSRSRASGGDAVRLGIPAVAGPSDPALSPPAPAQPAVVCECVGLDTCAICSPPAVDRLTVESMRIMDAIGRAGDWHGQELVRAALESVVREDMRVVRETCGNKERCRHADPIQAHWGLS